MSESCSIAADRTRPCRTIQRRRERDRLHAVVGTPEQFTFAGANGETVYGYVMRPANFDAASSRCVHRARRPAGFVRQSVELSLEPADVRGCGLREHLHRFPWLARLRPGVHGFDQRRLGRQPLEDLQKGLAAALEKFPWLDGNRMCALGASYGGHMINWIAELCRSSERRCRSRRSQREVQQFSGQLNPALRACLLNVGRPFLHSLGRMLTVDANTHTRQSRPVQRSVTLSRMVSEEGICAVPAVSVRVRLR